MSQIAIYVDDDLQTRMDRLARKEGKSRSQWVKEAILEKLSTNRFPEEWFRLWGTWEDTRSTEDILKEIDEGLLEADREPLR